MVCARRRKSSARPRRRRLARIEMSSLPRRVLLPLVLAVSVPYGVAGPILADELKSAQQRLAEMQKSYLENHPKLTEQKARIAELQRLNALGQDEPRVLIEA